MPTKLLYLEDAYQKAATAKVVSIEEIPGQLGLVLDRTIFYAQGGGQPADQGVIEGPTGKLQVSHVSYNQGSILHKGKAEGGFTIGQTVTLTLDLERRYQHMQWHTAGHVLDQAVKNVMPNIHGVDGNHGIGKKMYVEFDHEITADQLPAIQKQIDEIRRAALPVTFEMVTKDELEKRHLHLPFDLPTNKPLRIVQIGEYPPMPDGGTQLQNTSELWPIEVSELEQKEGKYRVLYRVTKAAMADSETAHVTAHQPTTDSATQTLSDLNQALDQLKQQLQQDQLPADELHTKYLGKKGLFNELAKVLPQLPVEQRKEAGQLLNKFKEELAQRISEQARTQTTSQLDLTLPGIDPGVGHLHPITQAINEITHIFEKVGFTRVRYPEVDWDWYVFEALNMPPNHPARDEWETFFVDASPHPEKGKMVLTTHTSNGQVREMERLNSQPPIRMINIARCYRRQQDATHTQMFHQFEGLVVDKGINIQHLKGTLDYFAAQFYGPGTKSRIRPFHFQFTEPSFEVDFSCHICDGTGSVTTAEGETTKCKFCKSGWHEVGGAGMVHPNVLQAGGIDPEVYTGFAFGWGVERTYTLKPGLNIDDIRLFYSGDLRFLRQF